LYIVAFSAAVTASLKVVHLVLSVGAPPSK